MFKKRPNYYCFFSLLLYGSSLITASFPFFDLSCRAETTQPKTTSSPGSEKNKSLDQVRSLISGSSLKKALTDAYNNNTEIKDQRAAVRSTDESVPQALAGWRPTITAQASLTSQKGVNSGDAKKGLDIRFNQPPISGQLIKTAQGTLSLKQNLYNGGGTIAQTHVADSNVRASRFQLLVIEQRIILNTIQAYLDLFAKISQIDRLKGNVETLRNALTTTQAKFSVGEETRTSVAQAQAQLDDGVAQLRTAEADLEGLKATYQRLTGTTTALPITAPKSILSILPKTSEEAFELAQHYNPSLKATAYDADAARHAIDQAKAGLLPKLDLQASVTRTFTKSRFDGTLNGITGSVVSNDRTINQQVILSFSLPIYEAGVARSKIRQAHSTSEQKRIAIETTRRQVKEQLTQAWENYLAAQANVQYYQDQVKSFKISLNGTEQEVTVGSKILLDVLNEQSKLLQAQLNLVSAERSLYLSAFQLLGAMGLLTAKALGLEVDYYDPEVYYNDIKNSW
jgi:TolC family type I secretion outer membrane protein